MNDRSLALPDESTFRNDIAAINQFQAIVRSAMKEGHDYGVIPGTGTKPTLLKPGAEKIAKLLGLADTYIILDKQEDWRAPFFRYLMKCQLTSVNMGVVVSEGLGECNSYESKYRYRWISERDLPAGVDKTKLVSQERRSSKDGHWTVYRMDNDDIFSQVNTLVKMAKKRALVDAALSAGRLSDLFTQDIEEMTDRMVEEPEEPKAKTTQAEIARIYPNTENPDGPMAKASAPSAKEVYLLLVAEKKNFKNAKTALTYLTGVHKIDASRLDTDLDNVKKEIAQIEGWK